MNLDGNSWKHLNLKETQAREWNANRKVSSFGLSDLTTLVATTIEDRVLVQRSSKSEDYAALSLL